MQMKKFGKFIFTTVSLAAVIGSAVYVVKNILNKESSDEFDDSFDDFDFDDEEEPSSREYVTININDPVKDEASTDETNDTEQENADNTDPSDSEEA